ncbi:CDP-diacylglycerol--serine O-phosphatidyltransferase [Fulvivirga sedimenti]|uniref:CDP-diacylglycerol--serine O-phosphatidyltransferase n=1 Tax=Fulvivirga sedimenti TaxID=2879465 RepID=A0A9X1L025_9BACT|nr:CDP-diacylglycerol--serine O-phosphatidyltransferase [Fulvivirga sedimenti]MCA6078995.1 CDP-diacylglycerol--serine O-phosphatidyltransferase [Fulvivirga sedimenti]
MSIKKHIPNFLTCCNLLCGCIGIYYIQRGSFIGAAYLIYAALIFDFLDGFVARLLHVSSPIGKELDSLADMVTFGVLPSFILFKLIGETELPSYIAFFAFLIAIFSALRLAKFNIDDRQQTDFIGLPTPANALFISSLFFLKGTTLEVLTHAWVLVAIAFIFSFLLVSPLRMFSLKVKSGGWKGNEMRIIFLLISILCLIFFKQAGIPLIIFAYLLLSLISQRNHRGNEAGSETF